MLGLIIIFAVAHTGSFLCEDEYGTYEKDQKWIHGSFVMQCQEVNDGAQRGWRIDVLACLTTFYQEIPVDTEKRYRGVRYKCESNSKGEVRLQTLRGRRN